MQFLLQAFIFFFFPPLSTIFNCLKQEVKAAPNAEVVAEKAPVVQQPKKESPKVKHDVQVSSKCAAFKGSVHQNMKSVV